MKKTIQFVITFLIITILCGLIYVTVQQSYRTAANDPQNQIAEDIAQHITDKNYLNKYFSDTVDVAASLSPFAVLYDQNGDPIRSSAFLDGEMLHISKGVFKNITDNVVITCEPRKGVRLAMVIYKIANGFVASGRSLREVEKRESTLFLSVGIAWICLIGLLSFAGFIKNAKPNNSI